ncbi:MAG: T9SS type A sorting domain-containing protein [Candidatus Cloacimonetes bacterium]|nr:T9SS type A sorting domain-containing protein [Candidatus Cloacimonadota bacterium]
MKNCITIFLISLISILSAFNSQTPEQLFELQNKIDKQTLQFQNSENHQLIKANRDTRSYEVGDQVTYWAFDLSVMPPGWVQIPSTCRAVGEYCYVFVADEDWDLYMDESDVQIVFNYLENETMAGDDFGAVEMDIQKFGEIPDELDNDPKLIVFYSALGSFGSSTFDGYFSSYNQVTEAEAQQFNPPGHSNECEMIYMTCHPLNPTDPVRISVLAHELQHLIHWGYDPNEDTWVDEGMAELAMVYFGMPDPISSFPTNPDNSLTVWDQNWSDYVKVMLFFTYLEEQYDDGTFIKDIVAETANSITGISNQLIEHGYSIPFEAIFTNWTVANYLDDPEVENGLFNYENLDLPLFASHASHSTYPVNGGGNVNKWASEYIKLYPADNYLQIDFETNIDITLAAIRIGVEGIVSTVDFFPISGITNIILPELTEDYARMILVVANNTNNSLSYSYSVSEIETPSIVGSFNDWDPADPDFALIENEFGVFEHAHILPVGTWEYKIIEGDTWDAPNYPENNQVINLGEETEIIWKVNLDANLVTHTNPVIAGNFISELGGNDWDPTDLTGEMIDYDDDEIFEWECLVPEGTWEFKVVLNQNWDQSTGLNITLISDGLELTSITYNMANNETTASGPKAEITFIIDDSFGQTHSTFFIKGSWDSNTGLYDPNWGDGIETELFDDGSNGDEVSGDHIYSVMVELVVDGGSNTWEWGAIDENHNWIDGNWQFQIFDMTPQTFSYTILDPPRNLVTTVIEDDVEITWLPPITGRGDEIKEKFDVNYKTNKSIRSFKDSYKQTNIQRNRDLLGYNIYRFSTLVVFTTELSYMDYALAPGTYEYFVSVVYDEGESNLLGPVEAIIPETSIGDENISLINNLGNNYPNPFNPETEIRFVLKNHGNAELTIYNLKGQKVITLYEAYTIANEYITVKWNGKDHQENDVSSGVYLYKLKTDSCTFLKKMIMVK